MINIATGSLTNFTDLGNVCNLLAEYEQLQSGSGSVTVCPPVAKHMVIFRPGYVVYLFISLKFLYLVYPFPFYQH